MGDALKVDRVRQVAGDQTIGLHHRVCNDRRRNPKGIA